MLKIIYTEKVKRDLIEIKDYISLDSIYYSLKVIESIKNTIDLLKIFPKIGKEISKSHRMIVEKDYLFKIIYKIEKDNILILGVFKYKNDWK